MTPKSQRMLGWRPQRGCGRWSQCGPWQAQRGPKRYSQPRHRSRIATKTGRQQSLQRKSSTCSRDTAMIRDPIQKCIKKPRATHDIERICNPKGDEVGPFPLTTVWLNWRFGPIFASALSGQDRYRMIDRPKDKQEGHFMTERLVQCIQRPDKTVNVKRFSPGCRSVFVNISSAVVKPGSVGVCAFLTNFLKNPMATFCSCPKAGRMRSGKYKRTND